LYSRNEKVKSQNQPTEEAQFLGGCVRVGGQKKEGENTRVKKKGGVGGRLGLSRGEYCLGGGPSSRGTWGT